LSRIRQLPERMAAPQRAEDVDRLADLPDGLRQGDVDRRRQRARADGHGRRAEAHARRMTPRRMTALAIVARAARRSGAPGRPAAGATLIALLSLAAAGAAAVAASPPTSAGSTGAAPLVDCHVAGIRNVVRSATPQRPPDP